MSGRVAMLVAAALAGIAAAGCDDPLVPPEEIVDVRVLAARAEVDGDAERSSPRPGEALSVRVLAAGPEGAAEVTWGLLACEAEETTTGLPRCRSEIARASTRVATSGPPSLAFTMPASSDVERVAIVGVVCDGGSPALSPDPEDVGCRGGARRAAPFVFRVTPSSSSEADNDNPLLGDGALRLDGTSWTADVDDPCDATDGASRIVAPRSASTIAIDVSGAAEPVDGDGRETIEVAHYVTAGDLERHYTVFEPGDAPRAKVSWTAPRAEGPAHFYAVARDGRGGVTWLHRAACVRGG